MRNAIKANPNIGNSFMDLQFQELILQPLKKLDTDPQSPLTTLVVVADALDECDPEWHATKIISLLPQLKHLSSIRLKFFVTSRPEFPIRLEFNKISGNYKDLVLHLVDEYTIKHDISVYFKWELSKTRNDYNTLFPDWPLSPDWPGQTILQILVEMAIPLFIVAKTICLFIQDRGFGDPDRQLNRILEYQTTMGRQFQLHATYLPVLDQMLMKPTDSGLVNRSDEDQAEILKEFREIVGTIVILADPLPTGSFARLLGTSKQTVDHRLSMLHSVLNIPPNADAPVKLLHLSFRDFLVHPNQRDRNPFWVDEVKTHEKLVVECLNLLSERNCLKRNICGLQMPGETRKDIDKQTVIDCLPLEVQYACLYWVHHLKGSKRMVRDGGKANIFLRRYLLHWLEALSLMGRISESMGLIDQLQSITDVSYSPIYVLAFTERSRSAGNRR